MKMKAVTYLRRSTKQQEHSIRDQRRVVEKFGVEHDYKIVAEFVDDGISGAAEFEQRHGFHEMIRFVESGKGEIGLLICYDLSRFGRAPSDESAYYRHRLKLAHCRIEYVMEALPRGRSRELVRNVLQWQKNEYLRQVSRDVLRGQLSAAQRGSRLGGTVPYGYLRALVSQDGSVRALKKGEHVSSNHNGRITLVAGDPERVEVVRQIFKMCTEKNMGMLKIARELNRSGAPSPARALRKVGNWTPRHVSYMLKDRTYIGEYRFNHISRGKYHWIRDRSVQKRKKGPGRVTNPKSQWIVIENAHEPTVSKRVFGLAQRSIKKRDWRQSSRNIDNERRTGCITPLLFAKLVYCGRCGHRMYGFKNRGAGIYKCCEFIRSGCSLCDCLTMNSIKLDTTVLHLLTLHADAIIGKEIGRHGHDNPKTNESLFTNDSLHGETSPGEQSPPPKVLPVESNTSPNSKAAQRNAELDPRLVLAALRIIGHVVNEVRLHFETSQASAKRLRHRFTRGCVSVNVSLQHDPTTLVRESGSRQDLCSTQLEFDAEFMEKALTCSLENTLKEFVSRYRALCMIPSCTQDYDKKSGG